MANSTTKDIGKNIALYRKLNKLTQDELSEKSEISSDYLSEIERGKKVPGIKRLYRIAESLNIEPYKLLIPANS